MVEGNSVNNNPVDCSSRVGEPRHAMEKGGFKPFLLIVHKCGNHTKSSRSRLDTDFAGFCMGRGQMVVMVGNLT